MSRKTLEHNFPPLLSHNPNHFIAMSHHHVGSPSDPFLTPPPLLSPPLLSPPPSLPPPPLPLPPVSLPTHLLLPFLSLCARLEEEWNISFPPPLSPLPPSIILYPKREGWRESLSCKSPKEKVGDLDEIIPSKQVTPQIFFLRSHSPRFLRRDTQAFEDPHGTFKLTKRDKFSFKHVMKHISIQRKCHNYFINLFEQVKKIVTFTLYSNVFHYVLKAEFVTLCKFKRIQCKCYNYFVNLFEQVKEIVTFTWYSNVFHYVFRAEFVTLCKFKSPVGISPLQILSRLIHNRAEVRLHRPLQTQTSKVKIGKGKVCLVFFFFSLPLPPTQLPRKKHFSLSFLSLSLFGRFGNPLQPNSDSQEGERRRKNKHVGNKPICLACTLGERERRGTGEREREREAPPHTSTQGRKEEKRGKKLACPTGQF